MKLYARGDIDEKDRLRLDKAILKEKRNCRKVKEIEEYWDNIVRELKLNMPCSNPEIVYKLGAEKVLKDDISVKQLKAQANEAGTKTFSICFHERSLVKEQDFVRMSLAFVHQMGVEIKQIYHDRRSKTCSRLTSFFTLSRSLTRVELCTVDLFRAMHELFLEEDKANNVRAYKDGPEFKKEKERYTKLCVEEGIFRTSKKTVPKR
eukprot:UN31777